MELFQSDTSPSTLSGVSFNVRFHHSNHFWHRLEVRPDGFHFRDGNLSSDTYRSIQAARVTASELRIGGVVIGEAELAVLKKLAAGELAVDIFSPRTQTYAYAADQQYSSSDSRRYVFAVGNASADYRRWTLLAPQ